MTKPNNQKIDKTTPHPPPKKKDKSKTPKYNMLGFKGQWVMKKCVRKMEKQRLILERRLKIKQS